MDLQIIEGIEDELDIDKWFAKGGPGSGHWGHGGRKGKRGGSVSSRAGAPAAKGKLALGRAEASFKRFTFEEDVGGGEIYRSDETYVAEALAEDLSKLPAYKDTPPVTVTMWPDPDTEGIVDAGYEGNPDVKYDTWIDVGPVAGMYNPKSNTVYLNPMQLRKDQFSPEIDVDLARKVFAHEYGHHVIIQRNHPENPGPGRFNPTSVFNNQTLSKLRALPAEKLADFGLVDHAISSLDELAAETYALSLHGSGSQNKALSDFYGKPLDEVLGEV